MEAAVLPAEVEYCVFIALLQISSGLPDLPDQVSGGHGGQSPRERRRHPANQRRLRLDRDATPTTVGGDQPRRGLLHNRRPVCFLFCLYKTVF